MIYNKYLMICPVPCFRFSAYGVPVVAEFVDGAECLEEDKEHEEGEEDDDVQVESDDEESQSSHLKHN